MNQTLATIPEVHIHNVLTAILVALVAIMAASLAQEPKRRNIMAIVLGVAGGTYLNGGLGALEFPFAVVVAFCAYYGFHSYRMIGIGWILHTIWDVIHHLAGHPMVSLIPTSSAECAMTDTLLALWFFADAPTVFNIFRLRVPKQPDAKDAKNTILTGERFP